jgi:predicted RNase H-like HicB family nuclease
MHIGDQDAGFDSRKNSEVWLEKYSFNVAWSDSDGEYVATSAEFPGLSGLGATAEAAMGELRTAMEVAVVALLEDGDPIPSAQHLDEHSGQFRLRIARSQHALLVIRAQREGISLNALIQTYVAAGLAADNTASHAMQRLDTILLRAERMLLQNREWSLGSGNALGASLPDFVPVITTNNGTRAASHVS